MQANNLIVLTERNMNNALPFLINIQNSSKEECMETGERVTQIITGLKRIPQCFIKESAVKMEDLISLLNTVHDQAYIDFLQTNSSKLLTGQYIIEHDFVHPKITPDTPIVAHSFAMACEGAKIALSAADEIINGEFFVYGVTRPPGHHAGKAWMGGYCYLNNAAIVVKRLLEVGRKPLAVLDLDFHFGNGTADILAEEKEVIFASLHASTQENYPYQNIRPKNARQLFEEFTDKPREMEYLQTLETVLDKISNFNPAVLIVSVGYDIVKDDPHGKWDLPILLLENIGKLIKKLRIPVCLIQEGGYLIDQLEECAYRFCKGLLEV